MRAEDRKRLTWEDATERFLDVTEIMAADRAKPMDAAFDTLAYTTHNLLTGAHAASQQRVLPETGEFTGSSSHG